MAPDLITLVLVFNFALSNLPNCQAESVSNYYGHLATLALVMSACQAELISNQPDGGQHLISSPGTEFGGPELKRHRRRANTETDTDIEPGDDEDWQDARITKFDSQPKMSQFHPYFYPGVILDY